MRMPLSFVPVLNLGHGHYGLDTSSPVILLLEGQEIALSLSILLSQETFIAIQRVQDLFCPFEHVQRQTSRGHASKHGRGAWLLLNNADKDDVVPHRLLDGISNLFQGIFELYIGAELLAHRQQTVHLFRSLA